jgi:hypothetical protein
MSRRSTTWTVFMSARNPDMVVVCLSEERAAELIAAGVPEDQVLVTTRQRRGQPDAPTLSWENGSSLRTSPGVAPPPRVDPPA